MLKIDVISAEQLSLEQIEAWSTLQRGTDYLDDPFFSPEFVGAVATVRGGVEVAVLRDDGQFVGFLPFERGRRNIGTPVGSRVSELQGIVAGRGVEVSAEHLLRACGLSALHFDCLLASHQPFQPYYCARNEFPVMSLDRGFQTYRQQRRQAGSSLIEQALRKARKLERELGSVRFEAHTTDARAFTALLTWKSAQYDRLGSQNVFRFPWVVELLERTRVMRTSGCSGMLSALYVGDHAIAVHLGIRGHGVLAWWFPAYDPAYAKYSPGLILLTKLAAAADGAGLTRIDLGQGAESYKRSFQSGAFDVAEVVIDRRWTRRVYARGWAHVRDWVQSSALRGRPLRLFRQARWWASKPDLNALSAPARRS